MATKASTQDADVEQQWTDVRSSRQAKHDRAINKSDWRSDSTKEVKEEEEEEEEEEEAACGEEGPGVDREGSSQKANQTTVATATPGTTKWVSRSVLQKKQQQQQDETEEDAEDDHTDRLVARRATKERTGPSEKKMKTSAKYEMCMHVARGTPYKCLRQTACLYAHTEQELEPKPFVHCAHKTTRCTNYDAECCTYGSRCHFLHNEVRVRISSRWFWLISPETNTYREEHVKDTNRLTAICGSGLASTDYLKDKTFRKVGIDYFLSGDAEEAATSIFPSRTASSLAVKSTSREKDGLERKLEMALMELEARKLADKKRELQEKERLLKKRQLLKEKELQERTAKLQAQLDQLTRVQTALATTNKDQSQCQSRPRATAAKKHVLYQKTRLCNSVLQQSACPYGKRCAFAHSDKELIPLVINDVRFKISECKNFKKPGDCKPVCAFLHDEIRVLVSDSILWFVSLSTNTYVEEHIVDQQRLNFIHDSFFYKQSVLAGRKLTRVGHVIYQPNDNSSAQQLEVEGIAATNTVQFPPATTHGGASSS